MHRHRIIKLLRQILKRLRKHADEDCECEPQGRKATVVRVIDGDSFEVEFEDGSRDTIRLLGVDTPEVAKQYQDPSEYNIPDSEDGKQWLLVWGRRASDYIATTFLGETVYIQTDEIAGERGYFNRLLAYVRYQDMVVNEELLKWGLARVYTGEEFVREETYLQLEDDAQSDDIGVWGFDERHK